MPRVAKIRSASQFGDIHLTQAEPLLQRVQGGIGNQFGHARHGQRGAASRSAGQADRGCPENVKH